MTLNVYMKKRKPILIQVFDLLGKVIYENKMDELSPGSNQIVLDLDLKVSTNLLIIRLSNYTYLATQKVTLLD